MVSLRDAWGFGSARGVPLRAGLLPGAGEGRAAAPLGALAALGSAQGFPCTGEFPGPAATQLCKAPSAMSLQPKSQPRISPYKGPRISVFLARHDRGVRVSGSMVLPSAPCAPFLTSHADVFSELFLLAHLRGLGLSPQDVPKLERVSKRFPAAWASLKTQNVTPVFWALRPVREKKCCWRQSGFDDSTILPVSVAQLIFFLFLKVALQPSCETPVVY